MADKQHAQVLSEADIEAIYRHPAVITASRKLCDALGAITGCRLASKICIPTNKFGLVVVYEDALGALKEALVRATHKRMMKVRR